MTRGRCHGRSRVPRESSLRDTHRGSPDRFYYIEGWQYPQGRHPMFGQRLPLAFGRRTPNNPLQPETQPHRLY